MRSLLFFSAVSSFWILNIPVSQAAVWYVNDTSTVGDSYTTAVGADTQSGAAAAPFRTIIKALNAAFSNDTIYVDRGIFDSYMTVSATETAGVKIDTDYISIIGMDSNATVIDPPGESNGVSLSGIYADTRLGLLIKNIGITGCVTGIRFWGVDLSTITGDSIGSVGLFGIYLVQGSETNTVTGNAINRIHNASNAAGIYLDSAPGNTLNNNIIKWCSNGIYLKSSSNNTVTNNTAESNALGNTSSGIYLYQNSNNNTVTNNTCDTNTFGIHLESSSNNTIDSNATRGNSRGIALDTATNSTISNNICNSNSGFLTGYGIYLSSSSNNNLVSNNTASSNAYSGIYLFSNSNNNTVSGNTANSNMTAGTSQGGIILSSCSNDTLSSNTANSNLGAGISLSGGSNHILSGNTVNSNSSNGIYLQSSTSNTVSGNTASSNTGHGINLTSSSSTNTIKDNITNSNTVAGITLTSSNSNVVSGNTARLNSSYGIDLVSNSNNVVRNNAADSNFQYGIALASSSNNTIFQNSAHSNVQYQIYISGTSSSDTIQKNDILPPASNPTGGLLNTSSGNKFDLGRNWWGITDSSVIRTYISGSSADSIVYTPFRIGIVDTSSNADTIAPKAPDTVAAAGVAAKTVRVSWSAVTANEEADPGNVALSGYRIYRSPKTDTSQWIKIGQVSSSTATYDDTELPAATTFHYRVTAFDTASPFENESFFSDSIPAGAPLDTVGITLNFMDTSRVIDPAGADETGVISFSITASGADTVTAVKIRFTANLTDTRHFDTVALYKDVNQSKDRDGADSFAGYLTYVPSSNVWQKTGLILPLANAADSVWLVVTVSIKDDAVKGDLFRVEIPALGIVTACCTAPAVTLADTAFRSVKAPDHVGGVWYVNDNSTTGDAFTTKIGDDTTGTGTETTPFRTITKALQNAKAGDTIYIDAGLYGETVVIDTDYIALIGRDSRVTTVDPPGASANGIYADTHVGLLIKNIGVTGAYDGIRFENIDLSTITGDSVAANGGNGIYLRVNSDTNTVSNNTVTSNSNYGIFLESSSNNTVSNNTTTANSNVGIVLSSSLNNTVSSNTVNSNSSYGIQLSSCSGNTVSNNTASSNGDGFMLETVSNNTLSGNTASLNTYGFNINTSSTNNALTGNNSSNNTNKGFVLEPGSNNNTLTNNTASDNGNDGFGLSSNNTLTNNIASNNSQHGFFLNAASNNTMTGNAALNNTLDGFYLEAASNNNTLTNNTASRNSNYGGFVQIDCNDNRLTKNSASNNRLYGFYLANSSNIALFQNSADSNIEYQFSVDGTSSSDTIQKNNIQTSPINPDSGVYNASATVSTKFTFTRNWWNTTDETRIKKMIFQAPTGDSVIFIPYRLGPVDTVSADSAAPLPPQNISVSTAIANALRLTWTNPTLDEDSTPLTGFGAVNVYRLVNTPDTTHWANAFYGKVTGGATQFIDSNVSAGNTYRYRLTSDDTHTIVNTSFFSDTFSGVPAMSAGDSVILVSGDQQVAATDSAVPLVMDVKDTSGAPIANATVTFTVEYFGSYATYTATATANDSGRVTYSFLPTLGDGLYLITAAPAHSGGDKARFVVYTDKRKIPVHPTQSPKSKWVMLAPFRKPVAGLTGLNQLSYSGTPISYSYSAADDAGEPWYGYKSVTNQSASENVSPRGTFSQYESGKGYWFRSSQATSVGLAGTPTSITDTFSVKLTSGANMIGSPFPFMIDWLDDVAVDTNLNDTPGPILLRNLTPAQAVATIDTLLQWRDQSAEQYVSPFASSETTVQMKPWAGFWVKVNASSCSIVYYPNKRMPQSTIVKQQSPVYQESKGDGSNWRMRLMAHSGVSEIRDEYTFIGVAPGASDGEDINDLWKAPGMLGDLQVWVGVAVPAGHAAGTAGGFYGASIAAPIKTAVAWPVRVTGPSGGVTLSWDASGLPAGYGAFLLGGPNGPVDMVQNSSVSLALASAANLTLVAGSPEFLAAYLAAPLTKDMTFVYPNPGPDATGNMAFKYNLPTTADVKLKIFDVGGKLVKEMTGAGAAGSNTLLWDTTNKHGQKLGSGVYIYILESGGNKLVDKLAIVR